jgi:hypothetical protein
MRKKKSPDEPAEPRIVTVREQRVILDADLARIYGVPTFRFNEAVKRNRNRFPGDFAFQLTAAEWRNLKSQIAISSSQPTGEEADALNSSQIAMSSHGGRRKLPWAFTEHGALMAANILRSDRAVEMSVYVVRAFIRQRELLATSAEILRKLELIDHRLLEHDQALVIVWEKIKELMRPAPSLPSKPKPKIGFHP